MQCSNGRLVSSVLGMALTFSVAFGVGRTQAQPPAPVNEYAIHADQGIVYDPLRREAEATGQLARYVGAATTQQTLKLGDYQLRVDVPKRASAYDVVPIPYELTWSGDTPPSFPIAVEAVAFEDEARRKGQNMHDLALPGRIDLDVEFLGSITAHIREGDGHKLTPDISEEMKEYPPYDRKPMANSSVIEAGDLVWFKFRYTNTGDTILDPEGLGGCLLRPQILRKNDAGEFELAGEPYNLYRRDLEYLYPGESHEIWIHCTGNIPGFSEAPNGTPQGFGLLPGEYQFRFKLLYRLYSTGDTMINMWEGALAYEWEMPFSIAEEPAQAPIQPGKKLMTDANGADKITRFIHTFEEFMTAFDCHLEAPPEGERKITGTLHLQVAPWTEHVVVKLVGTDPVAVSSQAAGIEVDSATLGLEYCTTSGGVLIRDGLREPMVASQLMADMRTNVQIGPFPEKHIRERMIEMQECGINTVASTGMPWLYWSRDPRSNYQGDAQKYSFDVARDIGLGLEGLGAYPYDRSTIEGIANWISGKTYDIQDYTLGGTMISHRDPQLPAANAEAWLYQFRRWGDNYYQTERGHVPVSIEDSRGWMRLDINIRYPMGEKTIQGFRDWAKEKYKTIQAANAAWGSGYASFDDVEPEKNQVPNRFGHHWEYTDASHPFHDWNAAIADLDTYRTELRIQNYQDTLDIVRETIPGAMITIRTEGANVLIDGMDPADPNPHLRHIYYSQRRCGLIADIIQKSGLVAFHSDYTTIPYTPSEITRLVKTAVAQGVTPAWFPNFDNMRDIAINDLYGTDYQTHYNLPEPKKGYMMHVLTAVYPWWKATYEAGGVPGALWEDYQCDGFVTETQKREMRLFAKDLKACLNKPEVLKARAKGVKQPDDSWREGSKAKWSYSNARTRSREGTQAR